MHSGGLNSTFAVKYWLDQGHEVFVHHVEIGGVRHGDPDFLEREAAATAAICEHLKIPADHVSHSVCRLDGLISPMTVHPIVAALAAATAIVLCLDRQTPVNQWAMGWWQGSEEFRGDTPRRCQAIMEAAMPDASPWNVPAYVVNSAAFDHAEAVRILGRDLYEKTWSCYHSTPDLGACGQCRKCTRLTRHGIELAKIPSEGEKAPARELTL